MMYEIRRTTNGGDTTTVAAFPTHHDAEQYLVRMHVSGGGHAYLWDCSAECVRDQKHSYYLAPADDVQNIDAAGEANGFDSAEEASAAIPSLRECDDEMDIDWTVVEFVRTENSSGNTISFYREVD